MVVFNHFRVNYFHPYLYYRCYARLQYRVSRNLPRITCYLMLQREYMILVTHYVLTCNMFMYRILLIWETCIIYRIRVHCAVDPWLATAYYFETESCKRMRNIIRISCRLSRFSIFIILLLVPLRILMHSCTADDAHIHHPLTHNWRELSQESFESF